MPLTQEQFLKARQAGFSVEQIAEFQNRIHSESPKNALQVNAGNPDMQGGAKSPALQQAKQQLQTAQIQNSPFSILSQGMKETSNQISPTPQNTLKVLTQPIAQTITGKSLEDIARERSLAGKDVPQSKVRPFDKNIPKVANEALSNALTAQEADMATTPSNYIGLGAFKPIVKAGGMAAKGIGQAAKFESGRLLNSLIKPANKAFNFGKNPGQQVVKEGITAGNIEELSQKITGKLNEAQKDLQTTLSQPQLVSKIDNYSDAIKPLDEAIANAKRLPKSNSALIKRLENAKKDLMKTGDITKLNPVQAVQLKRDIGDITKWTKEGGEDDIKANVALKKSYNAVKQRIEKNIPGVKEKNERLANLIDADIATKRTSKSLQRADIMGGIYEKVTGIGGVIELLRGDVEQGLTGLGMYGLKKAMDSPLVKTHVAQWLNKLSQSDIAKAVSEYPQLRSLLYKNIKQNQPQPTLTQQPFKNIRNP